MATETHVRGDTIPLVLALPGDATAATLLIHTAEGCLEVEGSVARSRAYFTPGLLPTLMPGRVYRTSARVVLPDGLIQTIDGFALRIEEGCVSSFYVSGIPAE